MHHYQINSCAKATVCHAKITVKTTKIRLIPDAVKQY